MKRLIMISFFMMIFSGMAFSKELIIKFKSGNSVSIKYSGTIQDIRFNGDDDAITGIMVPQGLTDATLKQDKQPEKAVILHRGESEELNKKKEGEKGNKRKWFRIKWAAPKDE